MPELTELDKATASMTEKRKEETASSDSDSDDTIPELEDAGRFIVKKIYCNCSYQDLDKISADHINLGPN